jgi:hypothetical protein
MLVAVIPVYHVVEDEGVECSLTLFSAHVGVAYASNPYCAYSHYGSNINNH